MDPKIKVNEGNSTKYFPIEEEKKDNDTSITEVPVTESSDSGKLEYFTE